MKLSDVIKHMANSSRENLLLKSAENGDERTVKDILTSTDQAQALKLANYIQYDKPTLLMLSAKGNHMSVVRLLVEEYDADVNRCGVIRLFGKTVEAPPIICAAAGGSQEAVTYLLSRKASVNSETSNKSTALMYACMKGSEKVARLLMEAGCGKEHLNSWKNNALMIAALEGHSHLVKLFLSAGAELDRQNINGKPA